MVFLFYFFLSIFLENFDFDGLKGRTTDTI